MVKLRRRKKQTCIGLHVKYSTFCPILTKFGVFGQIFVEVTHTSFHGNLSSRSRADKRKCEQTETQTLTQREKQKDGRDEANKRFSRLSKRF